MKAIAIRGASARQRRADALPGASAFAYAAAVAPDDRNDDDLVRAYRDGDAAAFERLYARHRVTLYNYLRRHLGSQAGRAEELFQDTWLKAIDALERYQEDGRFSAWLFRIAHNAMVDQVRRGARDPVSFADPTDLEALAQPVADGPAEAAMESERSARLRAALERLPPEQREAFLLREEAGLDLHEIARETGVGMETAKSRLRYAVKALRAALGEETGR